ncbi:hypothetical protein T484DRAFT_1644515 [Baffinella frigidus]|nr:hypothetical protein T484DRAFT_1644515 [Cryptophyta sp. CCMP2293]
MADTSEVEGNEESEDWTFQLPVPSHFTRRILVTGGCGFMGSAVVDRLVLRYPEYLVVVLDALDECASLCNLATVISRPNFRFLQADIGDSSAVANALSEHKIDTVIHLAAQTSVDKSFKDPSLFTQVNVVGTQRLLEACRASPMLKLFLFCSTDEVPPPTPPPGKRSPASSPYPPCAG